MIVVPTGNADHDWDALATDHGNPGGYLNYLTTTHDRPLIDPAPAALALTVGGTAGRPISRPGLREQRLGTGSDPSALTRCGPGQAGAVKPELVADAGTLVAVDGRPSARRVVAQRVLARGPSELFAFRHGTSFAAPAVTHALARVRHQHPDISPELARALVLQSAEDVSLDDELPPLKPAAAERRKLPILGYGKARPTLAALSSDERVVLVDERPLPVDSITIYTVPLPSVFFESGRGPRTIDLAMAFSPGTRHGRLDYLGSRLYPFLFHGVDIVVLRRILGEATLDDLAEAQPDEDVEDNAADNDAEPVSEPRTLTDLSPFRIGLWPSSPQIGPSANIVGRWRRYQALNAERGDIAHLVVRSVSRWSEKGVEDPFAVALAVGYEGGQKALQLHTEIEARLDAMVELPVELRVGGRSAPR